MMLLSRPVPVAVHEPAGNLTSGAASAEFAPRSVKFEHISPPVLLW